MWVSHVEGIHTKPAGEINAKQHGELDELLARYKNQLPDSLPQRLPPVRDVDNEIELDLGASPPSRSPYRLPKPDLDELQRQLTVLLERGFTEPSKSPFGAPVFFVKKADGSLRMVCDWRQSNKITITNKACMPNADDLFDVVQGCEYFSKLDLHSGYNQVSTKDSDVAKTAINTPFGHFQFRVVGFGLTNAPATFQTMMNHILRQYLRKFAVVFLDDTLIFSKTWKELLSHVEMVLQSLEKNQLYINLQNVILVPLKFCFLAIVSVVFLLVLILKS